MLQRIFDLDNSCKNYQELIKGFKHKPNNFQLKEIKRIENDILRIISEIENLLTTDSFNLIDYNYFKVVLSYYNLLYLHHGGKVMDIFKRAEEFDADYYEMRTGYTYHIQEYNRAKRFGLPTIGIRVTDYEGNEVGYCREPETK